MASNQLDPDQTARRRKVIGTGLVAVLAAALIAIVVVRSGGEKLLNENGDTLVLVGKEPGPGTKTPTRGELVDLGGCLGFAGSGGPAVVIWPHGTTVATPDPLRVKVDGTTYKLGTAVKLPGDYADPLDRESYFYDRVSEDCRTADVFIVRAG